MRVFGDELRASGAKVQSLGNRFPLTLGPPYYISVSNIPGQH